MTSRRVALGSLLILPLLMGADKAQVAADKAALTPLQDLVGDWKGVGRPKRGSSKDSWSESVTWSWVFDDKGAALAFSSKDGKYLREGILRPVPDEEGEFTLETKDADGESASWRGELDDDGSLSLRRKGKAKATQPARMSLKTVADGDRLILLLESQLGGTVFSRLGEIGFTREGGGFAKGAAGPICIVTGGKGTMPVTYKGKTYYVCCSGCKDLFDEDPEGCIRDAEKAKKED